MLLKPAEQNLKVGFKSFAEVEVKDTIITSKIGKSLSGQDYSRNIKT